MLFYSQTWNPWKHHVIPLTVTVSRMMDINFLTNQNPAVIPYQTAGFWFNMWSADGVGYNSSILKYTKIGPLCVGIEWLKGTTSITVECFNVTRNRLIQTGSTNYNTCDFKISQNLIWAVNHCIKAQKLESEKDTNMYWGADSNDEMWHDKHDFWTKEQIPQQHKKTHTIHFPRLSHGKLYRYKDFSHKDNFKFLIPGAQGITKWGNKDLSNATGIADNSELINRICNKYK